MNEEQCRKFWLEARAKVLRFKVLDEEKIVFGVYQGGGHEYKLFPVVTEQELAAFETKNGLRLPLQYRTYLQYFGAGGGGPYYGILDFRKYVEPYDYTKRFPLTKEVSYYDDDELEDSHPVWERDGLACLGTMGCGADYYIELNGVEPGQMWVDGDEFFAPYLTLVGFYQKWLGSISLVLDNFQKLKPIIQRHADSETVVIDDVISIFGLSYNVYDDEDRLNISKGEVHISFGDVPANLIFNDQQQLLRIELFRYN